MPPGANTEHVPFLRLSCVFQYTALAQHLPPPGRRPQMQQCAPAVKPTW